MRKKWPVLDIIRDQNDLSFQGADAYGSTDGLFKGTSLGTITTDAGGLLQAGDPHAGGLIINAFGDRYDSGWQPLTTPGFFQGAADDLQNGNPIYAALPFPTIPSSLEVWIGQAAAPVGVGATKASSWRDGGVATGITVSVNNISPLGATIPRGCIVALHAVDTTTTHMLADGSVVAAATLATDYRVRIIARR